MNEMFMLSPTFNQKISSQVSVGNPHVDSCRVCVCVHAYNNKEGFCAWMFGVGMALSNIDPQAAKQD